MSNNNEDKREVAYYPEICVKLAKYLKDCMPGHRIAYSQNKNLSEMVKEIYDEFKIALPDKYYPPLKTDIAFGVCDATGKVALMLIEVKRGTTLSLMNFSQLVGYMQVAKHVKVGLLLLVNEGVGGVHLSADFNSIITLGQLPACWDMNVEKPSGSYAFKAGVCAYIPGGTMQWVDSNQCGGISNWENLCSALME